MASITIIATIAALTGCAALQDQRPRYDKNSLAYRECAYQAALATPPSPGMVAGWIREEELTNQCMQLKVGY